MADINILSVQSEEQTLSLLNGYTAEIKFNPFYKYWFYDLYLGEDLVYAGVPLEVGSRPLHQIYNYYIAGAEAEGTNKGYEPFLGLGAEIKVLEIRE